MAPSLRIPARLDMDEFRQNVAEARSKVSEATDFMIRQLERTAAKSAIFDLPKLIQNSDGARQITQRAVQAIATDIGKLTGGAVNSALPTVLDGVASSARMSAAVLTTFAIPAGRGLAEAWVPIIARAAALYLAFEALRSVADAVSREIELMGQVAEKARDRGLSPETFQAFIAAAKGAVDVVQTLESALDTFFQANKRRLDDSVSPLATDAEKEKWTELSRTIREIRFEMDGITEGPRTFLNAGADMNKQLLGVVQTMKELHRSGQDLVALDLAEKAFGSRLADNLRTGKVTIDQIADTVQQKLLTGVKDGSIFSDATVKRAKEIDDQLKNAWQTVDQNLRPSMEALDNIALDIKSAWVSIVKLIAEGAKMLGDLSRVSGPSGESQVVQFRNVETTLQSKLRDKGLTDQQRRGLEEQLRTVQSKLAQLEASQVPEMPIAPFSPIGQPADVPIPRRRPINVPAPSEAKGGASRADKFDTAADSVEKRTASLEAETRTIDLNTQARERAKIVAELEAVAKQANAAAGKGENVITAEQAERINEVADGYARAAAAIEQARSPLATFARESQNLDKALNQFAASSLNTITNDLASAVTGTKSLGDAFRNMATSIIGDLARIAIQKTITGPIASILFSGGGGIGSILGGIFGSRDSGGPVEAGKAYRVNENTPNSEIFVPSQNGMIYPTHGGGPSITPAAVSSGGGSVQVSQPIILHAPIDARGADQGAVIRIGQGLEQLKRDLPRLITTVGTTARLRGTRP